MNYLALVVIICTWGAAFTALRHDFGGRLFVTIVSVSTVFYGVLGPWYWLTFESGWFLGVNWSSVVNQIPWLFLLVHVIVTSTFVATSKWLWQSGSYDFDISASRVSARKPLAWIMLSIGLVAAMLVVIRSGSALSTGSLASDPFILILYQFSDIPIGVLLYLIATRRLTKGLVVLVALYVGYSTIVGLRYRLALLLGPLAIYCFFYPWKRVVFARLAICLGALLGVGFLAIMTLTRSKFSGLNLEQLQFQSVQSLLYGLFAETNTIYGLASALSSFGSRYEFVGLTPVYDTVVQFVPRFMFPEKHLNQHLQLVLAGLGNTDEAMRSGTAMPFFGEYYAMFGWTGVVGGSIIYALLAAYVLRFLRTQAKTNAELLMALALFGVFWGYYYFSRGSIAQITMTLLFAVGPMLLLLTRKRLVWRR